MLNCSGLNVTHQREQILHDVCRPLINTLRQLDPVDFVLLFYSSDSIAIREHFSILVEQHFRRDHVSFGLTGECHYDWNSDLKIAVDLELLTQDVFACFRIWLMREDSKVEINHLAFETHGASPDANTQILADVASAIHIGSVGPPTCVG